MVRLHSEWRQKLGDARSRYAADRCEANREEYLRILKVFSDIVLRHELPDGQ